MVLDKYSQKDDSRTFFNTILKNKLTMKIKDLDAGPDMIKLLEENIDITLFHINCCDIS